MQMCVFGPSTSWLYCGRTDLLCGSTIWEWPSWIIFESDKCLFNCLRVIRSSWINPKHITTRITSVSESVFKTIKVQHRECRHSSASFSQLLCSLRIAPLLCPLRLYQHVIIRCLQYVFWVVWIFHFSYLSFDLIKTWGKVWTMG